MADHAEAHGEAAHQEHTHHGNYWRIWAILCVLLAISVAGPFFGHPVVTLVTAFGIACVKAWMVAKNFMHISAAPRFVAYLIGTCLLFMMLFYAGVGPDVMKLEGTNWEKPGWIYANAHAHDGVVGHHGEAGETAHH